MILRCLAPLAASGLLACTHAASAQTASLPAQPQLNAPTHIPALTLPGTAAATRVFLTQTPTTVIKLDKPPVPNRACLAIRSYNYTADANNPQLSGSTTCTVAKSNGVTYAIAPATR